VGRVTLALPRTVARLRSSLTRADRRRLAGMAAVVLALHVVGWGALALFVAPHADGPVTIGFGLGITAYTLGMRHAFDADHICAIDNTTRKLMHDGQRPLSVGFWFSLGHATVVFALTLLLSLGVKALVGPVRDDSSSLHHYTGLVGTAVSGTFLYVIAGLNLVILLGVLRTFRAMRSGEVDEAELQQQLDNRGLLNRFLGGMTRSIRRPWQIYPVGVLFGLGFDTASEVALLVLAGSSAVLGLPWYAVLCLPVLFAAGMTLLDTLDGSFMNVVYGWALAQPVRKVFYNLTITGLSVAVALLVGSVELLGLAAQQLGWTGGFWGWLSALDLNTLGFVIVGLFALTWLGAVLVWRHGRIEEKWTARLRAVDAD
jgi:high-affinity nickel-transport protein